MNVGIICSCLLTFPAFLERYGAHGLGSFISKLVSLSSSWRSEIRNRFGTYHSSRNRSKQSNEMSEDDHSQLNANANMIRMQRTIDVTDSIENVEQLFNDRNFLGFPSSTQV